MQEHRSSSSYDFSRISTSSVAIPSATLVDQPKFAVPMDRTNSDSNKENQKGDNHGGGGGGGGGTPTSTPTSARKSRRRSNLFTPSKKASEGSNSVGDQLQPQLGSGRSIPVRQGYLYKKSSKSFSKDWKKKYVTLCDDGRMTYHPSLHVSSARKRFFSLLLVSWNKSFTCFRTTWKMCTARRFRCST